MTSEASVNLTPKMNFDTDFYHCRLTPDKFFSSYNCEPPKGAQQSTVSFENGLLHRLFDPTRNDEKTLFSLVCKNLSSGKPLSREKSYERIVKFVPPSHLCGDTEGEFCNTASLRLSKISCKLHFDSPLMAKFHEKVYQVNFLALIQPHKATPPILLMKDRSLAEVS